MDKETVTSFSAVRLWKHLEREWRVKLIFLVIFMFISGFAEIVTLGSVVPFLAVLIDASSVHSYPYISDLIKALKIEEEAQLIIFLSAFFGCAVIISALLRLIIYKLNFKWSYELIAQIAISVFKRTLHQPYVVHTSRNSSELVSGINIKIANLLSALILPLVTSIQLIILILSLSIGLFLILPISNLFAILSFALAYALFSKFLRQALLKNSKIIAEKRNETIKILQEALAGIKDIILSNSYETYNNNYAKAERLMRTGLGRNAFITLSPRFIVEALGILVIIGLVLMNYSSNNSVNALPALGALALAAQRMLPYLQQLYAAFAGITGNQQSTKDALELLDQAMPDETSDDQVQNLSFNNFIEFKDICFSYPKENGYTLKNINLKINKGEVLGVIGSTGSGKSTLIDLLLGLIHPTEGYIYVDGRKLDKLNLKSWYKRIFHVPQAIFLADSSIKKNIALGIRESMISLQKVKDSSEKALLADYVESLPKNYETKVGERGMQLSGGQRQRIAIARAFYKGGDVLVLDEATNSLDRNTESKIVKTINGFGDSITTIIVAHNLETIKDCDKLVIIEAGKITEQGRYMDIKGTDSFKKVSGELI